MLTELGTDGAQMWASQVVEGWNWMKRPFDGVFLFLFKYILWVKYDRHNPQIFL